MSRLARSLCIAKRKIAKAFGLHQDFQVLSYVGSNNCTCTSALSDRIGTVCRSDSLQALIELRKQFQEGVGGYGDAFSLSSDLTKRVMTDLHAFMNSDEDEVPQSLRQLAKLARSEVRPSTRGPVSSEPKRGIIQLNTLPRLWVPLCRTCLWSIDTFGHKLSCEASSPHSLLEMSKHESLIWSY